MFGRIKLHPFIKANPPHASCVPATKDLLGRYEGRLPVALLELWRKHGLGLYGRRQICLIDPDAWQSTLDRWIVSLPSATVRVPIALTPFGTLLFYRKLTATDEDVSTLNPVSRSTRVLSWSLADLFNGVLSDPGQVDEFIRPAMLDAGRQQAGALSAGEAYHVDPMLLSMQMLKIVRTDALALHQQLRAQVDREQAPPAPAPNSVSAALPEEYRCAFRDVERKDGHPSGLYLSTYIDWRRLLALQADGSYQLLFWKNDHKTGEPSGIRHYSGHYRAIETEGGDCLLRLDLVFTRNSLGSDVNDDALYLMQGRAGPLLLQACRLEDMATAIGGRATMGSSEHYFRPTRLADPFPGEDSDGMAAPAFEDLPAALQALVHREPLRATIVEVGAAPTDPDDSTVMVWVDLGSEDGLRMNMPLISPKSSPRALHGWVWEVSPRRCGIGIEVERDETGAIVNGPQAGDVLVTRAD
ncbi:hypothetical protein SAMN05518845_12128 [Variovorax sp. YR750]|uniref:GAD-like domain-containing protein n=1 Tax=Variovorax sp. YR750 TaxID=1884384 RepID=UPI0008B7DFB3|nr:GAD-like domain-containing protein [Variovorax sp. YR750]SEM33812.1 hypothetical protein SAMN05518845_12128 [Variovorax sp. YR750]